MTRSGFEEVRLGELLAVEPQPGIRQQSDGGDEATPYVTTGAVSQGPSALSALPRTSHTATSRVASFSGTTSSWSPGVSSATSQCRARL